MPERPNVLFIIDDQHRHDFVGYAGADFVRTPNVDRLAERGTAFTHCCTNAPVCGPARIALATGLLPTRLGTTTNSRSFMPLSAPNHYRHFRDHGYRVELVGRHDLAKPGAPASLHGNRPLNFSYGFTRALEVEGGMSCARAGERTGQASGPYTRYLREQGLFADYVDDFAARREKGWIIDASHDSVLPTEHHQDSFVGRKAVERIRGMETDYPWYMLVSFQGPHDPFDPPTEYAGRYREADVPPAVPPRMEGKPRRVRRRREQYEHAAPADIVRARRQYCAKIELIDAQVGRMMRALEERGMIDDTIVVFASDHGEHLGDHGLFVKHTAYEPSMRVPLAICGPGVERGTTDALVELFDLNPTLVQMGGLPAQPDLDARSFVGVLRGERKAHREDCVACEGSYRAIRTRRYKYIETENDRRELYDLSQDRAEQHNIAEEQPDRSTELAARLRERFRQGKWRR